MLRITFESESLKDLEKEIGDWLLDNNLKIKQIVINDVIDDREVFGKQAFAFEIIYEEVERVARDTHIKIFSAQTKDRYRIAFGKLAAFMTAKSDLICEARYSQRYVGKTILGVMILKFN